jgi:hypothetical protein
MGRQQPADKGGSRQKRHAGSFHSASPIDRFGAKLAQHRCHFKAG